MASQLTLYTVASSGNAYRARLLASLLKVPLIIEERDFFGGELKTPEYLAINPRGSVPALVVDDDLTLHDSASILTYLAGHYSDDGQAGKGPSSYWSNDAREQARIINWVSFASTWINDGLVMARYIHSFNGMALPGTLEQAQTKARRSLEILDAVLSKQEWLALARPTIGDVAVFAYTEIADESGVSLEPYPHVRAWVKRVRALPRFIKL